MTKPTIQERRKHDLVAKLGRAITRRDDAIKTLVRTTGQIGDLTKAIARAERRVIASRRVATLPEAAAKPKTAAPPPATPSSIRPAPTDDELEVPGFLRRVQETDAKDKARADQIRAEQAATRKTKSQVRIEKMKAKQGGETKKMPLTGKAALAFIQAKA